MSDKSLYPKSSSNPNLPQLEKKIQEFWQKNNIFEKSIKNRKVTQSSIDVDNGRNTIRKNENNASIKKQLEKNARN